MRALCRVIHRVIMRQRDDNPPKESVRPMTISSSQPLANRHGKEIKCLYRRMDGLTDDDCINTDRFGLSDIDKWIGVFEEQQITLPAMTFYGRCDVIVRYNRSWTSYITSLYTSGPWIGKRMRLIHLFRQPTILAFFSRLAATRTLSWNPSRDRGGRKQKIGPGIQSKLRGELYSMG